jgi:hexosaminidase
VLQWKQVNNDVVIEMAEFNPNKIKSQHAYVIKINNDGKFVKKPKATVNYLKGTTYPTVQIETIPNTQIFYTLDGTEPTTAAIAYKLPFSVKNDANLNFAAFADGLLSSNTQSIALKIYHWQKSQLFPNLKNGISLTIYETPITAVEDLLKQKPLQTKLVKNVSLSDTTRKEHVGLVFEGWIKIPEDAVYDFYLSGDDGTKLWIDNQVLIPSAHVNGSDLRTAKMALKKGFHQIKLAYLQIGGDASLKLQVESPSFKKQNIPSSWWFTNSI